MRRSERLATLRLTFEMTTTFTPGGRSLPPAVADLVSR
jgi:hypothetical protein